MIAIGKQQVIKASLLLEGRVSRRQHANAADYSGLLQDWVVRCIADAPSTEKSRPRG